MKHKFHRTNTRNYRGRHTQIA